jgi:hypothetical protein
MTRNELEALRRYAGVEHTADSVLAKEVDKFLESITINEENKAMEENRTEDSELDQAGASAEGKEWPEWMFGVAILALTVAGVLGTWARFVL